MILNIPQSISSATLSATITTTWSSLSQTITVAGILSTDTPIIDVDLSSVSSSNLQNVLNQWGYISRIVCSDGSITVYALTATTIAIPISIKVIR